MVPSLDDMPRFLGAKLECGDLRGSDPHWSFADPAGDVEKVRKGGAAA
jgi:hypothetical protein